MEDPLFQVLMAWSGIAENKYRVENGDDEVYMMLASLTSVTKSISGLVVLLLSFSPKALKKN